MSLELKGAGGGICERRAEMQIGQDAQSRKAGAGGDGPILTRLGRIAKEIGFYRLCTVGLGARCVMIGTLTAGQFLLFDVVMDLTGAEKFHFHNPADDHH